MNDLVILISISLICVLSIITRQRFSFEQKLRDNYGIDREWYVPIVSLIIAISLDVVAFQNITASINSKIDILLLILLFSFLSEGMSDSGLFRYIGGVFTEHIGNSKYRLITVIYLMTSFVTLFTTNDIVVLAVTPVVFSICIGIGLRNLRLILLSQFIAANTVAMSTFIGSPTNIILAEELGIDFFEYLVIMGFPGFLCMIFSLGIILFTVWVIENQIIPDYLDLDIKSSIESSDYGYEDETLNYEMKCWMYIFAITVLIVSYVTVIDSSLLLVFLIVFPISVIYWIYINGIYSIIKPLSNLPYGILFFGITFFTFGDVIANSSFIVEMIPVIEGLLNSSKASVISLLSSVTLVNMFNDLPAAAIIAPVFDSITFQSTIYKIVSLQGVLIGLNIGKYVTQVGSLAGLIWFNQIRVERSKARTEDNLELPTRMDLITYGGIHFILVSIIMMFLLLLELMLTVHVI